MRDKKISLKIITPDSLVLDSSIDYLLVKTSEGEKGILPGHEKFMATLEEGILKITVGGNTMDYYASPATLVVEQDTVTILANFAAPPEDYHDLIKKRTNLLAERYAAETAANTEIQKAALALHRSLKKKN